MFASLLAGKDEKDGLQVKDDFLWKQLERILIN